MSKLPTHGANSLSKGMWHQYGDQIKDSEGIWMSVSDIPSTPLYSKGCTDESVGNGCVFIDRPENVVSLRNTNAEVILYIRNWALLGAQTLVVDGSSLCANAGGANWTPQTPIDAGPPITMPAMGWIAATDNYTTAMSIANAINSRVYLFPNLIYFDDTYGSSPAGVPLSWRVTASVFLPETYPWIDNAGPLLTDPVAAIRIQFVDSVTAVTNYPNYYAAGVLGNSRTATIGSVPMGWMLLGNDLLSDDKRFAASVRFRNGASPQYTVKSLADLVGFKKETKRLGEVAEKQKMKEAIVAIPFVEKSGHKQFFRVPRFEVDRAEFDRDSVGKSVLKMVDLMKQYVFPPQLDFLTNRQIEPFAMYIFEFEIELTKRDLQDIWQNLLPQVKVEIQEAIFSHKLNEKEFFGVGSGLESSLRWLVFKVKQKANWNYYTITPDSMDDHRYKFNVPDSSRTGKNLDNPPYSYNWPYDYCSIVELAKMDVKVKIEKKKVSSSDQRQGGNPLSGDALEKAISDVVAVSSEQAIEKAASKKKPR